MGAGDDPHARLRRSWARNADAWTRAVREGRIGSRREGTDRAVLEAVARLAPGRVLDVGCGEGWLAHALAARGCAVVGVDGSEALVRAAREGAHPAEPGAGEFVALDYGELIADPALLPGPFAVVVCNFSLFGEDLAPLLRALRARLAADGRLVVQTLHPWSARGEAPYRDGWREERFDALGGGFAEPMPWFYRTLASWVEALAAAGLTIVRLEEPAPDGPAATGRAPLSLLLTCAPR